MARPRRAAPKSQSDQPVLAVAGAAAPPEVAGLTRGWLAAHLEVGAHQTEVRQVQAAEAVLTNGPAGAERLVDAHLLRGGYRAWAKGERAAPDVAAYRGLLDPQAILTRQRALDEDARRLAAEWAAWEAAPRIQGEGPADRLRAAERREQGLLVLLRQAEQLALLRAGYRALADGGVAARRPGEVD